jgi:hypothetical protein
VASALAQLGQCADWMGEEDLVFCGETGAYLDGSALRRRYKTALTAAGLRRLRFHDLRHTFGTRMIAKADIRRVQEWMGHADIQTTMRYECVECVPVVAGGGGLGLASVHTKSTGPRCQTASDGASVKGAASAVREAQAEGRPWRARRRCDHPGESGRDS